MADRASSSWAPRLGIVLALATLVGWSVLQRWSVLDGSPFPIGVDGYFYPVQLRSLLETGELQYPASPLAFYLLAPFAAATDPITGAKLGAAFLGALIALPAYGVGVELTRRPTREDHGRGPGLIAAALATTSAGSFYLSLEFVKNGIGLTVALTALWLVLRALATPTRRAAGLAIAGIAAALLTHKMAAGLVLGIAIPAALAEAHRHGKLRWRRVPPIAIGLGILVVIGLAMPQRFLSPKDLALIEALFTTDADWSLPVLANKLTLGREPLICAALSLAAATVLILERPTLKSRLLLISVVIQTVGELIGIGTMIVGDAWIITGGSVVLALGGMLLGRRVQTWPGSSGGRSGAGREVVAWSVIALGVVIALPWLDASNGQGLAVRLRVIAFVPMTCCGAIIARAVLRRIPIGRAALGAEIALVIVILRLHLGTPIEGRILTHPALIASAQAVRIPDGGVAVVQERHIAFMLAWYTRATISMRPEPIAPERRYRVMPLALIRIGSALDAALLEIRDDPTLPRVIGVHPLHPNGMVVVPEVTWRAILERLDVADRRRLEAWPTI